MISYLTSLFTKREETKSDDDGPFVLINHQKIKYTGNLVFETSYSTLKIKGPFENCEYEYVTKDETCTCEGTADLNENQFIFTPANYDFSCATR